MQNKNKSGESQIRRVLFSEASIVAIIVGTVFTIFNFFFSPVSSNSTQIKLMQKDINLIQTNHLVHIQDDIEEIKEHEKGEAEKWDRLETRLDTLKELIIEHSNTNN